MSNLPHQLTKLHFMKILKVIEVLASSEKSWDDAAQNALKIASKSIRGIKSINIQNMSAQVDGKKITEYRINAKISFEIDK
jgi:dodecin